MFSDEIEYVELSKGEWKTLQRAVRVALSTVTDIDLRDDLLDLDGLIKKALAFIKENDFYGAGTEMTSYTVELMQTALHIAIARDRKHSESYYALLETLAKR